MTAKNDPAFWAEIESHYDFIGRPSRLQFAARLTEKAGGARIWLKREDLNHTGAHKINNAIGQVLLAKRLGKTRIIAETGAGQHGVATATVCAKFGLPVRGPYPIFARVHVLQTGSHDEPFAEGDTRQCVVYMGSEDVRRQAQNVFRIRMLGAQCIPVESGAS